MEEKKPWEMMLTAPSGSELLGPSQSSFTKHSPGLTPALAVWQFCPMNKVPVNQKVPLGRKSLHLEITQRKPALQMSAVLKQHHLEDCFYS